MVPDVAKSGFSEDTKKLAEKIVSYETREKGAMGNLFAFEARDGFWSKLAKTLGPLASTLVGGLATFTAVSSLVAGPVGLVVAGVAAAAIGLVSGGINRAVNESIFSDLHDSHKGNLGKFGHYLGIGLVGGVVGGVTNAFLPGLGTVASSAAALLSMNVVNPLVEVLTNKAIVSGFGDQQLRRESAEAKEIAQQAIQSGQSVEQLLGQGKPVTRESNYTSSEAPEQTSEKSRNFTQMIEQQRTNSQNLSIA
ncbi:MAG: hypothetical protein V4735_00750 [Pseudomonadota bacterium]